MKRLFSLYILASVLLLFQASCTKKNTYEEVYNLSFKISDQTLYGWISDANNSFLHIKSDTTNIERPLRISQGERWGWREKMDFSIYEFKKILLPELSDNLLKVKILYKCKNINNAGLFIYSINKSMSIIKKDSISLYNSDDFQESSAEINIKNAHFLYLQIKATGKDSTYTQNNIGYVKRTIPHEIFIKRIQLLSGTTNINSLTFKEIDVSVLDKDRCMRLSSDSLLTRKQLSSMTKRITTLGETVHGSKKIQKATSNFIKSSIINNQTSLVLFEHSILKMLFFNRYIQGYEHINIEKLRKLIEKEAIAIEPFLELVTWMKKYNKLSPKKVHLLGNDIRYERNELNLYLQDFFKVINNEYHSSTLDTLISTLGKTDVINIKHNVHKALTIIENNKQELGTILGDDLEIITFYMKSLLETDVTPKNSYYERDYNMYKYTSFLIDSLCNPTQNIVISCHLGHANYLSTNIPFHKSFGFYMKHRYADSYACIAQTIYQDTIRAYLKKEKHAIRRILSLPSSNSIESSLSETGLRCFYVDTKDLDEIIKSRHQGFYIYTVNDIELYLNSKNQIQGILHVN